MSYSANGAASGPPPAVQLFAGGSVTISGAGSLAWPGYTFAGWNSAQDGSGTTYLAGTTYSVLANLTLYAVWVPANTYQVTYLSNGATGGTTPTTETFTGGSSVSIATNTGSLGLAGSTFGGWNTVADGSGTSYAAGVTYSTAQNLTLYAVWLPANTYGVIYVANNPTGGTAPISQAFTSGSITIASNPGSLVRAGSTFTGWNTAADGSGTTYPAGSSYSTHANLTLYAAWTQIGTYDVVYSPNGADGGTAPAAQTFSTSPVTIGANTFTRSGYQFIGWNTSPNGTGTNYSPGESYGTSANLNLYPQWLPTASYAVVYNPNGASGSLATQTFSSGGSVTVASGNSLTLSSYVFGGWNTAAAGTGISYSPGATYNTAANVTLYAQFAAVPYTVTYDANNGGGTVAPQSFSITSGDTISSGSGLARAGDSFAGWNTANNGSGTSYTPGDTYDVPINLYLYAQWIPSASHAVIYDANGGGGSTATQTFASGGSVTIADGSGLSRTGYTFVNWTTQANGGGSAYGPTTASPTYSTSANLTLYAEWAPVTYTVTYNANGGSGTAPTVTTFTLASPAAIADRSGLSNTGYTFSGWNTATDGTGQTYNPADSYALPYNLALYAAWTPVGNTVGFNANGGTGSMNNEAFPVGVAQALTANAFSRTNYTFVGWNTAVDDSGTSYADGQSITLGSAVTLYAQWIANATDTVTLKNNDGSATYSTLSGADGNSVTLPASETAAAGTTFAGWATSANATTAAYSPGATYTLTGSLTLYAVFTTNATDTVTLPASETTPTGTTFAGLAAAPRATSAASNATDPITIRFNSVGADPVPPIRGRRGSTVTLADNLKRVDYIFLGWFTSPNGGTRLASAYTLGESTTLYAQWKRVNEVSTRARKTLSEGDTVTKGPIRATGREVIIGTANFGLKIRTGGSSTTFAGARITLVRGSKATISGFGFKARTIVRIYLSSKPLLLGTAKVSGHGTYTGSYLVPARLADGRYMIRSVGTIANGTSREVEAPVTVTDRATTLVIAPFGFSSSLLTPKTRAEVVRAAKIIKEYRVRSLTLTGYTDPRGSIPYNLALSRRRTDSVQTYLLSELRRMDYLPTQAEYLGRGKFDLVVAGNGTVENAASRRVTISEIVARTHRGKDGNKEASRRYMSSTRENVPSPFHDTVHPLKGPP